MACTHGAGCGPALDRRWVASGTLPGPGGSVERERVMSDGGQVRKGGSADEAVEEAPETEAAAPTETRDLLDDVDELLDEIDDVLEENAEEFVRGYVQKGGQ
jgi:prokaryotic ubiquitin-like protein Pup